MRKATIYDRDTGRFIQCTESSVDILEDLYPSNFGFIEGIFDFNTNYMDMTVDTPIIMPRPTNPAVINKTSVAPDGIDSVTLSGVPEGTVITVDDESHTMDNTGTFEFSVTFPGAYIITLVLFPYLDKTFEVGAG